MGITLTEKEKKLIELLRTIPYGHVVIYLEKANPVQIRILRVEETVKL